MAAGLSQRLSGLWQALGEVVYGMTGYEFERTARARRAELEDLFMLLVFGDLIGLPVLPPPCALRLLPYVVSGVPAWQRRVLRPREPFESEEVHVH